MEARLVCVEPDRWVIGARGWAVRIFEVDAEGMRLEFDSGLELKIEGRWRASLGASMDSPVAELGDGHQHVGAHVLSLVLFAEGSMRLILSDALFLTAGGDGVTRVSSRLPGVYAWTASADALTTWLSEEFDGSGTTKSSFQ